MHAELKSHATPSSWVLVSVFFLSFLSLVDIDLLLLRGCVFSLLYAFICQLVVFAAVFHSDSYVVTLLTATADTTQVSSAEIVKNSYARWIWICSYLWYVLLPSSSFIDIFIFDSIQFTSVNMIGVIQHKGEKNKAKIFFMLSTFTQGISFDTNTQ